MRRLDPKLRRAPFGPSEVEDRIGFAPRLRSGRTEVASYRLPLTLALLAACTSGSFPAIDQVTGLTVIAIKADPPDQTVIYDGGGVFDLLGPGGPGQNPILPITVTTLIADPGGNGRAIQTVFATCAQLDPTSHQCLPTSPDYQVIGASAAIPDAGPAIVAGTTFTPGQQLLGDALALDPLHGFGYLPLPVQVTATAGANQVVAVKTLTFSPPIAYPPGVPLALLDGGIAVPLGDAGLEVIQPADMDPVMPPVTLNGVYWDPDAGPPFIDFNGATIGPTTPASANVPYFVPEFDGGLIPFTDYWSYELYCTAGSFDSPRAGGGPRPGFTFVAGRGHVDAGSPMVDDAGETIPGTMVQWSADAGVPSQLVYFWIVALDGRGGVDFTQLEAQYEGL
jgi:hypothetical protein